MKGLIKFLFFLVLVVVFLFNFKILSTQGFIKFEVPNIEAIEFLASIKSVEYYKNPLFKGHSSSNSGGAISPPLEPSPAEYIIVFYTQNGNYLIPCEGDDITALRVAEFFAGDKIEQVEPWHWGFFVGALVLIMIIPGPKKSLKE